jgi:hypothetical protein
VARLRRSLGDASLIATRAPGYLVAADPKQVDAARFEAAAAAGRAALRGEPRRAATLLHGALGLWRREPLGGVPAPFAEAERTRLHVANIVPTSPTCRRSSPSRPLPEECRCWFTGAASAWAERGVGAAVRAGGDPDHGTAPRLGVGRVFGLGERHRAICIATGAIASFENRPRQPPPCQPTAISHSPV